MLQQHELNGHIIEVQYNPHSLHIKNNGALEAFLAPDMEARSKMLAEIVLREFERVQGRRLDFGIPSLTIEIIAHVYAGRVAGIVEKVTGIKPLDDLMNKVIGRCRVIDAGEAGHDMDRKVWDVLAPFTSAIVKWLPGKNAPGANL
ncbi:MAG: hypothetical protein QM664_05960 [Flavihumibacter sp.]